MRSTESRRAQIAGCCSHSPGSSGNLTGACLWPSASIVPPPCPPRFSLDAAGVRSGPRALLDTRHHRVPSTHFWVCPLLLLTPNIRRQIRHERLRRFERRLFRAQLHKNAGRVGGGAAQGGPGRRLLGVHNKVQGLRYHIAIRSFILNRGFPAFPLLFCSHRDLSPVLGDDVHHIVLIGVPFGYPVGN